MYNVTRWTFLVPTYCALMVFNVFKIPLNVRKKAGSQNL